VVVLVGLASCQQSLVDPVEHYVPAFEETSTVLELCDYDPIDGAHVTKFLAVDRKAWMVVGYGGGCESHYFKLCWNGEILEEASGPVAELELVHEGNQDGCEAGLSQTLSFDLAALDSHIAERLDETAIRLRLENPGYGGEAPPPLVAIYDSTDGPEGWCDVLAQDCPPPLACLDFPDPNAEGFGCASLPNLPGQRGEDCWEGCDAGLYCEPEGSAAGCDDPDAGCCTPYCDVTAPSTCGPQEVCTALAVSPAPTLTNLGRCLLQ
jgi:hypothetical protein